MRLSFPGPARCFQALNIERLFHNMEAAKGRATFNILLQGRKLQKECADGGTMGVGKTSVCQQLKQKLNNSVFPAGDWCWVMHEQSIIDAIAKNLDTADCMVKNISLICNEDTLRSNLQTDIDAGKRSEDIIERSVARIPMYQKLNTVKIFTDHKTVTELTEEIRCV